MNYKINTEMPLSERQTIQQVEDDKISQRSTSYRIRKLDSFAVGSTSPETCKKDESTDNSIKVND